ncbi:MAG: hypothetical protein K2P99_07100 [Burkholderiales bacterium]|nr:hypothetical protein [Burkholderiales bacterium]
MPINTSKILATDGRKKLKTLVELAQKYLADNNTPYAKNKKLLEEFFKEEKKNTTLSKVLLLDAMYSTNLSKTSYAATEIADAIDDDEPKKKLNELVNRLKNNQANICDLKNFKLFDDKYGVQSNNILGKKCESFWSKYLYFTSDYNFPIFDSLAQETIKKLKSKKYFKKNIKKEQIENLDTFYGIVSEIKADLKDLKEFSYSDLDNFFWLFGKINNGSFSLLLSQEQYKSVINWVKKNGGLLPQKHDKESENERLKRTIKKNIVDENVDEKDKKMMLDIFGSTSKKCPDVAKLIDFITKCKEYSLLQNVKK